MDLSFIIGDGAWVEKGGPTKNLPGLGWGSIKENCHLRGGSTKKRKERKKKKLHIMYGGS